MYTTSIPFCYNVRQTFMSYDKQTRVGKQTPETETVTTNKTIHVNNVDKYY